MAHQIFRDRAFAFVGTPAWHGLGVKLPAHATYDEISAAAGFADVQERPLFAPGLGQIVDRKALVSADDGRYLATVGIDYCVVQSRLIAQSVVTACGGDAVFETAGLLGERGARGFLLGLCPKDIEVKGDASPIKPYFLASWAHDGSSSVILTNVATRVVCANTLGAAMGERDGYRVSVRHTASAEDRVKAAGLAFREITTSFEKFGALANALAAKHMPSAQMRSVAAKLYPIPTAATQRQRETVDSKVERLMRLANGDMDRGNAQCQLGTAWSFFNAAAEVADHHRFAERKSLPDPSQRLESVWLGTSAAFKGEALYHIRTAVGV